MKRLLTVLAFALVPIAGHDFQANAADSRSAAVPVAGTQRAAAQTAQAMPDSKFDPAAYYADKTIRILVGFSAGGGTDLQARHFAQHWTKTMPGQPRFRVTNIKPNTASANRLYRSPPDGMTLELTASVNIIRQFTSRQAKFKIEENRIIGTHTGTSSVIFARKDLPYRTLRDAIGGKTPIRIGQRNAKSGAAIRLAVLSEWLNIPMKFIPGARGTADNLIALERGDTDAFLPGGGGTIWFSMPFIRPGWLKDGVVRPIAKMGPSDIEISDNTEVKMPSEVPFAVELIKDPKRKELYEAFANMDSRYGKIFMAPPKTPDRLINVLRKSYEVLLTDKAFRAKLEKMMGEPVQLTRGAEMEPIIDKMVKDYAKNADVYAKWVELAAKRF